MDSSIRLNRIDAALGGTDTVSLAALSPLQVATIALEVLEACKGQLTYLTDFVRFGDYLWDQRAMDNRAARRERNTASRMYRLPESYDSNSFVTPLRVTAFKRWGSSKEHPRRRRQGFVYRQELFLSRDGDILVWDWFAHCEYRQGLKEVAIRSKVQYVRPKTLKKIFGRPDNARALITTLGWRVSDTIDERRKYLTAMEGLNGFIKEVERRTAT